MFLTELSLTAAIVVAAACAVVILVMGTKLTKVADQLADRTGIGEALTGAVLLGATTSLPGVVLSVSAAFHDQPELAMSNAVGGIAVQTFFLAIADLVYRRANLEHAAASLPNIMQAALLLLLLTMIALAPLLPDVTIFGAHPVTFVLLASYLYGIRLVHQAGNDPMWRPQQTTETKEDVPEEEETLPSLQRLWLAFLPLAASLATAGYLLERAASRVIQESPLTETSVGLVMTSVTTSLPELVTSVAAVRRGALTLAVAGIIGGNAFDTLFAASSDIAYQGGSIYHATSQSLMTWVLLTILMSAVLIMGLLRREKRGVAGIGVESVTVIAVYALGLFLVTVQ